MAQKPNDVGLMHADGIISVDNRNYSDQDFEANVFSFHCRCSPNISVLIGNNNLLTKVPSSIRALKDLVTLDLSANQLTSIDDAILQLDKLADLDLHSNALTCESLPKDFGLMKNLERVNFGANRFSKFPPQLLELRSVRAIYFGGNLLQFIPCEIDKLQGLEVLYLGGNQLESVPSSIGRLSRLILLSLSDNRLTSLPHAVKHLRRLESLALHNNRFTTLPTDIFSLPLNDLSLRGNPLVNRFVAELNYDPPSLLELSARFIKNHHVAYSNSRLRLPAKLINYLDSACRCVNPRCKGVYFTTRVEHIKFVDFCGRYRLPLLQYLCSPKCVQNNTPAVRLAFWSRASGSRVPKSLLQNSIDQVQTRRVGRRMRNLKGDCGECFSAELLQLKSHSDHKLSSC